MMLFLIGIIEMLIVTSWTRLVTNMQIMAAGSVTMVNVLIWYYVLQKIVNDISDYKLAILYALGCSIGTIISMTISRNTEERQSNKI